MSVPEDIDRLDHMIEQLKKKYELFFSGMERKEPGPDRVAVEQMARRLHTAFITNSAHMYRLKTVTTKLTTYQTYWDRVLRQMEEGTFRREIDKRKIIQKDMAIAREAERQGEGYISMGEYNDGDLDDEIGKAAVEAFGGLDHAHKHRGAGAPPHPAAHAQPPPAPAPKPAPAAANGELKHSHVAELYNAFVMAKRTLGEANVNVSLDGFKKQLEQQLPALRAKYKTDQVDFKISIRGGKASIKAVVGNKDEE